MYRLDKLGDNRFHTHVHFPANIFVYSFESGGVCDKTLLGLKLEYENHNKEFSFFMGLFRLIVIYSSEVTREFFNDRSYHKIEGFVVDEGFGSLMWGRGRRFRLKSLFYGYFPKYQRTVHFFIFSVKMFTRFFSNFRNAEVKRKRNWPSYPIERYLRSTFVQE